MSFSAQTSRVRDINRPTWYRLIALRECISLLSCCSDQGYQELLQQFDNESGLSLDLISRGFSGYPPL
jgi:hypothetical protein